MKYRILDLILLLILIPILLPIIIIISCYLFLTIGRPVLFIQNRAGKDGKAFKLYKFRTMANINEHSKGDVNKNITHQEFERSRVLKSTKFLRKTRLDETPQLFNIFKNDISFVGPRPLLLEYNSLYNLTQKKRLSVKPGITGWSQVNGANTISWTEKFELDVWYVENKSFLLNIKIIFMTFKYFIKKLFDNNDDEIYLHDKFNGEN